MIGASYRAQVSRDDDQVILHQRPQFHRRHAVDLDQRVEWAVQDTLAHSRDRAARRERHAAKHDDLDTTLAPLRRIAATLGPADREALLAHVIATILRPTPRPARPSLNRRAAPRGGTPPASHR